MTQMMGGEAVFTETQEHRDERHAAMLRMAEPRVRIETQIVDTGSSMRPVHEAIVPVLSNTQYVTPQVEPPKVIARDRALPYAIAMFVIGVTGGLAPLLPIDTAWLPAISFLFACISGAVAFWLRAVREGDIDQARAEKVQP
jgi:hypothetical protein